MVRRHRWIFIIINNLGLESPMMWSGESMSEAFTYKFNNLYVDRLEILDDEMTFTKVLKGIYQFNAIPDNEGAKKTMYWMKRTYEELYEN